MRTTYNRGAGAWRARLMWVVVLGALAAAAVIWRGPLEGVMWRMLAPALDARYGGSPSDAQAALSAAALADRDALYAENLELKRRLLRDPGVERILAGVLLRPPATPYDSLVIDAGFAEGVALGDKVAAGGTVLVGIVSELYAHAARVRLYSAPGESYEGFMHSAAGGSIPVTVEGQGGGSLQARVPADTIVAAGDEVTLAGVAGGVVARVSGVERGAGESFATVYLSLPVNPSTLRFVEVWKQASHDTE